jgi:hypothetical protein
MAATAAAVATKAVDTAAAAIRAAGAAHRQAQQLSLAGCIAQAAAVAEATAEATAAAAAARKKKLKKHPLPRRKPPRSASLPLSGTAFLPLSETAPLLFRAERRAGRSGQRPWPPPPPALPVRTGRYCPCVGKLNTKSKQAGTAREAVLSHVQETEAPNGDSKVACLAHCSTQTVARKKNSRRKPPPSSETTPFRLPPVVGNRLPPAVGNRPPAIARRAGEAGSGLGRRRPLPCQCGPGAIAPVWVS